MTQLQVLFRVEMPNALPLILGGLRNATLQVIATATIAAYVNLGGLGRYIFDGLALYNYDRVVVGAILVAVLALIVDGILAAAVWASVPGTGRLRRPYIAPSTAPTVPTDSEAPVTVGPQPDPRGGSLRRTRPPIRRR